MELKALQFHLMLVTTGSSDVTYHKCCFTGISQNAQRIVFFASGNGDNHAYTAVKGTIHFAHIYIAALLQPLEYRWESPALGIQNRFGAFRQYARNIFSQASASDVR